MGPIPIEELWRLDSIESATTGGEGYFPLILNVVGMANGETRKLNLIFSLPALEGFIEDLQMLYGIQFEHNNIAQNGEVVDVESVADSIDSGEEGDG